MSENILSNPPKVNYHEEAPATNFAEFRKIVESRRSVRIFTPEKIPDDVVMDCLDLALLAPTSSNLQCWEFWWVRDESKLQRLHEACFGQPAASTAQALIVCLARTETWKKHREQMLEVLRASPGTPKSVMMYYEKLVPFVYGQGPLGLFGLLKKYLITPILGLFRVVPRGPFGESGMREWAHKTTALACENLMLAFRAAGYDTCPMEGFDEVRVRKILDLPSDASVCMIIGAGKRAPGGIYSPRIRFPRSQFIKIT
jgi:nitroreductase